MMVTPMAEQHLCSTLRTDSAQYCQNNYSTEACCDGYCNGPDPSSSRLCRRLLRWDPGWMHQGIVCVFLSKPSSTTTTFQVAVVAESWAACCGLLLGHKVQAAAAGNKLQTAAEGVVGAAATISHHTTAAVQRPCWSIVLGTAFEFTKADDSDGWIRMVCLAVRPMQELAQNNHC